MVPAGFARHFYPEAGPQATTSSQVAGMSTSASSNALTGAPCIKGLMAMTAISSLISMKGGLSSSYLSRMPLTAASKFFAFNHPTELVIGLFML